MGFSLEWRRRMALAAAAGCVALAGAVGAAWHAQSANQSTNGHGPVLAQTVPANLEFPN